MPPRNYFWCILLKKIMLFLILKRSSAKKKRINLNIELPLKIAEEIFILLYHFNIFVVVDFKLNRTHWLKIYWILKHNWAFKAKFSYVPFALKVAIAIVLIVDLNSKKNLCNFVGKTLVLNTVISIPV